MNDIINWIAINDTLLIRIGFTAILVLIIVYIYRFFFVPKINIAVETPSVASEDKNNAAEAAKVSEGKASSTAASFDLSVVAKKTEEIENLKSEIEKLKNQITDSEKLVSDLNEKVSMAQSAPAQTESENTNSGVSAAAGNGDPDMVASLNNQIEQLQNRLAEYEIIAEDISEISQLRHENAELKKKLEASSSSVAEAAPSALEETPVEEVPIEEAQLEEVVVVDEPMAPETPANKAERESAESIKLVSDKEVTGAEKELINQFEEILTKKGS